MNQDDAALQSQIAELGALSIAKPAEVLERLAALCPDAAALSPAAQAELGRVRGMARVYAGDAGGLAELHAVQAQADALPPRLRYGLARSLSTITGLLCQHDEALDWAQQALALARGLGDAALLGDALVGAGVALSRSGQAAAGLALYEQALPLLREQGLWRNALSTLNNLGINHKNLGRPEQSLACFEQALALTREHPELADYAAVLRSNLSEPLLQLGRLVEARAVAEQALADLRAKGQQVGQMSAGIGLARVLLECGEPEAAQAGLDEAAELADRLGDRLQAERAHQQLYALHKAAGRYREALQHLEAAHELERAQFNNESDRRLRALQAQTELAAVRLDADQQRSRSLALERAQAELQQKNAQLLAADREKSRLLARLAEESRTDALTGLANRRRFDERLADEAERQVRLAGEARLSLAVLDVDFFKRVNDDHGHALGDAVLRELGSLLAARVRGADFAARLGGEEFCVLCFGLSPDQALQAAEAWRTAVAAHDWARLQPGLQVTVSIGIADWRETGEAKALLALADARLYAAKRGGRNRVVANGEALATSP
jgi:diguanylate cyclase (GGDEF)-like protein